MKAGSTARQRCMDVYSMMINPHLVHHIYDLSAASLTRISFFFLNDPAPTEISPFPLRASLPFLSRTGSAGRVCWGAGAGRRSGRAARYRRGVGEPGARPPPYPPASGRRGGRAGSEPPPEPP